MHKGHNITALVFLLLPHSCSSHPQALPEYSPEQIQDKPKLRHIVYNNWPVLFKTVKTIKNKPKKKARKHFQSTTCEPDCFSLITKCILPQSIFLETKKVGQGWPGEGEGKYDKTVTPGEND